MWPVLYLLAALPQQTWGSNQGFSEAQIRKRCFAGG